MKKILFLLLLTSTVFGQTVSQKSIPGYGAGFNTNDQNASALMEMRSTTKGFLPSRMTTTQRDLISSPAPYLMIANTTTGTYQFYNGSAWVNVGGGGSTPTLQETTTAGNETTNPIIIRQSATKWIEIRPDGEIRFFDTDIQAAAIHTLTKNGAYVFLDGDTYFGYYKDGIECYKSTGTAPYPAFSLNTTDGFKLNNEGGSLEASTANGFSGATDDIVFGFNKDGFYFNDGVNTFGFDLATGTLVKNGIPFTFNPATGGQLAITTDINLETAVQNGNQTPMLINANGGIKFKTNEDTNGGWLTCDASGNSYGLYNSDGSKIIAEYNESSVSYTYAGGMITTDTTHDALDINVTNFKYNGNEVATKNQRVLGEFNDTVTALTTVTVTLAAEQPDTNYLPIIMPKTELGSIGYYISATTTTSFDVTYPAALTGDLIFGYTINRN